MTMTPQPLNNLTGEEDNMNESEITYRVDQLMDLGKASAIRGWSMEDILKIIQNEYGPDGYEIARSYIVKDVAGIEDEEKYIEEAVTKTRNEKKLGSAKDKILEELEKNISEE
jgi:hypothetical protein